MAKGGDMAFSYGLILMAVVLMIAMPMCINILAPQHEVTEYEDVINQLNESYANFTGSAPIKEDVWALQGIYTPYQSSGPQGTTKDNWLYGTEVHDYTPSQYNAGDNTYTVSNRVTVDGETRNLNHYVYTNVGSGYAGISNGDVYSYVAMDVNQQSNIFFAPQNKHTVGSNFYYDYSGYRYSFSPISSVTGVDDNGNTITWDKDYSSCSLIWYSYYNLQNGIAGQLVINSSMDGGTAYITSDTIIKNLNTQNNTAKFDLVFNGVTIYLYLKLDSYYLSTGLSIQECFNQGYWSVMLTSASADVSSYVSPDYSFNPENIFQTFIDIFTFNLDSYGFSPMMAIFCSLIVALPLYVGLLVIGIDNWPVLILAGILLAIQSIVTVFSSWGGLF